MRAWRRPDLVDKEYVAQSILLHDLRAIRISSRVASHAESAIGAWRRVACFTLRNLTQPGVRRLSRLYRIGDMID